MKVVSALCTYSRSLRRCPQVIVLDDTPDDNDFSPAVPPVSPNPAAAAAARGEAAGPGAVGAQGSAAEPGRADAGQTTPAQRGAEESQGLSSSRSASDEPAAAQSAQHQLGEAPAANGGGFGAADDDSSDEDVPLASRMLARIQERTTGPSSPDSPAESPATTEGGSPGAAGSAGDGAGTASSGEVRGAEGTGVGPGSSGDHGRGSGGAQGGDAAQVRRTLSPLPSAPPQSAPSLSTRTVTNKERDTRECTAPLLEP